MITFPTAATTRYEIDGTPMRWFGDYQTHPGRIHVEVGTESATRRITVPVWWYDHGRNDIEVGGVRVRKVFV